MWYAVVGLRIFIITVGEPSCVQDLCMSSRIRQDLVSFMFYSLLTFLVIFEDGCKSIYFSWKNIHKPMKGSGAGAM